MNSIYRLRTRRVRAAVLVGATPWVIATLVLVTGCGVSSLPGPAGASGATGPAAAAVARRLHGLFRGFSLTYGGTASLNAEAPPASTALPGANDLLATGHDTVLAATSTGIWRSADGGTTWDQVLSGLTAWSLTPVLAGGYAAIGNLPAGQDPGPPVLATSQDGLRWQLARIQGPVGNSGMPLPLGSGYRIALSRLGPRATGVAVPDIMWADVAAAPLRTTDGGMSWTRITAAGAGSPPATASTGLAMTNGGRNVFITAQGPGASCAGAVYESSDSGADWSLLPASCQPYELSAVQFITSQQGFAAGGMPSKFGGAQVVEVTTDGGRTWRTTWRTTPPRDGAADSGFVRLAMVSAQNGWAVAGGCTIGQNGPCGGTVYRTTDGGYHWHRAGPAANTIAGLDPVGIRAVTADDRTVTTAATPDGGRTWASQSRPEWISTTTFNGSGSTLLWTNSLGDFLSTDAGVAWTSASRLAAPRFADYEWLAGPSGRLLGYYSAGALATVSSADGGRTWTTAAVPGSHQTGPDVLLTAALGSGGTAFAVTGQGAQCVSPAEARKLQQVKPGWSPPPATSTLFTSTNGGASWSRRGTVLPFGVGDPAVAAAGGSRFAIVDACGQIQLSSDAGQHWRALTPTASVFCAPPAFGQAAEIWLDCQSGTSDFWLLHSTDAGSTWTAFRLPTAMAVNGMFAGPFGAATSSTMTAIAAIGRGSAVIPAGASFWRTTDGGASWTQSWPAT